MNTKTEFEIGDRVRIREDLLPMQDYGGITYVRQMNKYKGCNATIISKGTTIYHLDIDNGAWNWSAEMFCPSKVFNGLI